MNRRRRRTPGPDALRLFVVACKSCGKSEERYITVRRALQELFGKCECGGDQSLTVLEEN